MESIEREESVRSRLTMLKIDKSARYYQIYDLQEIN